MGSAIDCVLVLMLAQCMPSTHTNRFGLDRNVPALSCMIRFNLYIFFFCVVPVSATSQRVALDNISSRHIATKFARRNESTNDCVGSQLKWGNDRRDSFHENKVPFICLLQHRLQTEASRFTWGMCYEFCLRPKRLLNFYAFFCCFCSKTFSCARWSI